MTRDHLQRLLLDGCDRITSMPRFLVSQEQRDVATALRGMYQSDYDLLDKIMRLLPVSSKYEEAPDLPASKEELRASLDRLLSLAVALSGFFGSSPTLLKGISVLREIVDNTETLDYIWDLLQTHATDSDNAS